MIEFLLILLSSVLSGINGQAATCEDIDPGACLGLATQNPSMCSLPELSTKVCPKYCNNCPVLCYSGPMTMDKTTHVVDTHLSNTITCNSGEVCKLTQNSPGSEQYHAECGSSQTCSHNAHAVICCSDSLCNTPKNLKTTTVATTTTTTTTTPKPTTPAPCRPLEIGFSARVTKNLTLEHSEKVVFDSTYVNAGVGYDETTGIFRCPVTGIYVFEVHTLARLDKHAWFLLYHNNNYIISIYGHTLADYGTAGNSVILGLNKGDQVFLKAMKVTNGVGTNIYGRNGEVYTTFNGYLISPVCDDQAPILG